VYIESETAQVELKVDECKSLDGGHRAGRHQGSRVDRIPERSQDHGRQDPPYIALHRHLMGCHFAHYSRFQNALNDVEGHIRPDQERRSKQRSKSHTVSLSAQH